MIWMLLGILLATPDTVAPRLPTLRLGRFVIYGLDTLHLQREVVEAYPRVVYTPEPGVPGLPAGFFAAPSEVGASLPLPQPASRMPMASGLEGFLLPAYGGISAGLALRAGGPAWRTEGWVTTDYWPSEDSYGFSRHLKLWSRITYRGQELELAGQTRHGRFLTAFFCETLKRPSWGFLRAHLHKTLGPLGVHLRPWVVGFPLWNRYEGVECGSGEFTETRFGEGLRADLRWNLNTAYALGLRATAYRASDTLTTEALAGVEGWVPWGRFRVHLGAGRTSPGAWKPLGILELTRPHRQGTRGITLYRRYRYPGTLPPPLHSIAPDPFSLTDPQNLWQAWFQPWGFEDPTRTPVALQTGGALWIRQRGANGRLGLWLGAEKLEHWQTPWHLRPVNTPVFYLRSTLYRRFQHADLTLVGGLQTAPQDNDWPLLTGFLRYRRFWNSSTWTVFQVRSVTYPTLDLWVQQRLKGALWAAAGVWNLLQETDLFPPDRRFFVGLWLNTIKGGIP